MISRINRVISSILGVVVALSTATPLAFADSGLPVTAQFSTSSTCSIDLHQKLSSADIDLRIKAISLDASGNIDPVSLLHFYDSLLQPGQVGFSEIIFNDFGFKTLKFGTFFRRFSWMSDNLKIPKISSRDLTPSGLATYAVDLAEYVTAYQASRLRLGRLNPALNPIAFVTQMKPFIENLYGVSYQITGILDPKAIRWRPIDFNILGAGLFLVGLGAPPIKLYRPNRSRAAEFNSGQPNAVKQGAIFATRAGAHWTLSRAFILMRVGFTAINVMAAANTIETLYELHDARLNYTELGQSILKAPADITQETREMIQDDRDDLAYYEEQLKTNPSYFERKKIEGDIRRVKDTLAFSLKQLAQQEKQDAAMASIQGRKN